MDKRTKAGNLPTAEDFLVDNASNPTKGWAEKKRLIEFAKLHVEAQAKAIHKLYHEKIYLIYGVGLSENTVINAYPLNNIK